VSNLKPFLPLELLDELPAGNPTLKLVSIMISTGHTVEEVAKVTGLSPSSIRSVMSAPKVQEFSNKFTNYFINNSPMARFNDLIGEAIDTITDVMRNGEKEAVRLKAANTIVDRVLGTALQRVEVKEDSTVKKLLEHLDKIKTIEGVEYTTLTDDSAPLILDDIDDVDETKIIEE